MHVRFEKKKKLFKKNLFKSIIGSFTDYIYFIKGVNYRLYIYRNYYKFLFRTFYSNINYYGKRDKIITAVSGCTDWWSY
jgi:hypothetical protein